jgi:hypothetical protein
MDGRPPDSKPGEAARAVRHDERLETVHGDPGDSQTLPGSRYERRAGPPMPDHDLPKDDVVVSHGDAGDIGGRIHCES